MLNVKTESLAPPLCLLGDDPASPFETVQITVGSASDDPSGNHTLPHTHWGLERWLGGGGLAFVPVGDLQRFDKVGRFRGS